MARPANESCPHGHKYTPENTWYAPSDKGARRCKTCRAETARRNYQKNRIDVTIPNQITAKEQELFALRQQYEGDPKNWQLGARVGRAEQAWIGAMRAPIEAEQRAAETAARAAYTVARKAELAEPHDRNFIIPPCPYCDNAKSKTEYNPAGYNAVYRVGNRGFQCQQCDSEWSV